jgi:hypothetical protein
LISLNFVRLTVRAMARQFGWDFVRIVVSLVLTGNAAPFGFT